MKKVNGSYVPVKHTKVAPANHAPLFTTEITNPVNPLPTGIDTGILLTSLLDNGPCLTCILDIRTQQFAYVSRNVTHLIGYAVTDFLESGPAFFNHITHPEDLKKSWELRQQAWALLQNLSNSERPGFKFSNIFRITKPDGATLDLLEQYSVLPGDSSGIITHVVGVFTDVSSLKKVASASITPSVTPLSVAFHNSKPGKQKPLLSKREVEILRYLAAGYNNKYIAATLFLSVHTVATHRKRIIEKTKTGTTIGAIQFGINQGFI